jgi:putative acetyltransferase
MDIRLDDLTGPEIIGLLEEHVRSLRAISPPESCHVLDLAGLRRPEITFWSAWQGSQLLGCAALKELDPRHGEIKSMRTASTHLRKGVAAALLHHIVAEAGRREYRRLSLETGAQPDFRPALSLYTRFGFERCAPFAGYVEDPLSVFMTRAL